MELRLASRVRGDQRLQFVPVKLCLDDLLGEGDFHADALACSISSMRNVALPLLPTMMALPRRF